MAACRPIEHADVEAPRRSCSTWPSSSSCASGLGVSVRDITDAAGQNGAAIHYHFGSRDAPRRAR